MISKEVVVALLSEIMGMEEVMERHYLGIIEGEIGVNYSESMERIHEDHVRNKEIIAKILDSLQK